MTQVFDAKNLRKTVLDMAFSGATVHIGCAFSIIEILAVLYRNHLRFHDDTPADPNRDYIVLSKGHGVMAQYACLHEKGWLSSEDIKNYFKNGTQLKGLADAHVPGVEVTSGSLGHGFSVGVGMAYGAQRRETNQMCYVIVGDGEINEGSIWEAALFASHFKLDNLIVVVDENGFQAMGSTEEVLKLGNIMEKFIAFGFESIQLDGHNESQINDAIHQLKSKKNGKPKAIIAKTVKGKGISFMENNNIWHYTRLSSETYAAAMAELEEK